MTTLQRIKVSIPLGIGTILLGTIFMLLVFLGMLLLMACFLCAFGCPPIQAFSSVWSFYMDLLIGLSELWKTYVFLLIISPIMTYYTNW